MLLSVFAPASATLSQSQPSPSGALLTVVLAAPAESPYLALAISRSGDDTDREAAQSLPTLHLTPDDLTALSMALDRVTRARHAMG
jgi:hypothetical protein